MAGVKIPRDAIGRPGMVAMLRRVRQQDVGKVVGLMHPVGFLALPGPGSQQVFSWRVLLMGQTVDLDDRSRREIVVADACLFPISQVPPKLLRTMAKKQALRDFDEAFQELRRHLALRPMTPEQLDTVLEKAIHRIGSQHRSIDLAIRLDEGGESAGRNC
jgi:hypothetical protein